MNPETDIICLQIVKGVPKAPGDTESAESELVVLDLLDPDGFSVQTDGWSLALPGIKRNGTWADTQISDGRTLIAAPKENVTESIQLAIGLQDLIQRYQLFAKLERMADDARAFWTDVYQIDPVYLKFKANGARVYQYALIYDMSIADSSDPYEIAEAVEVTLVLERESAWRMVVPPGGNPLEYRFWSQGKERGVDYGWEDLALGANTDHLVYGDAQNACELNGLDKTTFLTKTWFDIDGSNIPGDAPALVCITHRAYGESLNQLYVARSTEPAYRYNRTLNTNVYVRNTLNAGDSDSASKAVDSCGVRSNDQIVNRYIHSSTVLAATTTFTNLFNWNINSAGDPAFPFPLDQMHGEWALYLRCQITSGADGDVEAQIRFEDGAGTIGSTVTLPYAKVPYFAGGSCVSEYDLAYMGRVKLPLNSANVYSGRDGLGLASAESDWIIALDVRNTAGANRVFEVIDLIFMPISEGFCMANPDATDGRRVSNGINEDNNVLVIDNTGYFSHGDTADYCAWHWVESSPIPIPLLGSALTLKPGVNNRIYVFQRYWRAPIADQFCFVPDPTSAVHSSMGPFRLNIVPRCYGVADL